MAKLARMEAGSIEAIAHAQQVEKRWEGLEKRMLMKAGSLVLDRRAEVRLLNQALSAKTNAKKVFWLRKAADKATEAIVGLSACRNGCSHCCNVAVVLSKSEAVQISTEIGRPLNPNAGKVSVEVLSVFREQLNHEMYGRPCTFLVEGRCSIYEFRPQACRLQINMDDDDLLCRLVEASEVRVPYADMAHHYSYAAEIMDFSHDDVRNWFAAPAN